MAMKRDIIIVTYNQLDYTKVCVASIERNTSRPYRIIVVDNASDEPTRVYLKRLAEEQRIVLIQNDANIGWVKAVNKGIESSDAEYVCVMNNDTYVYPGWLDEMTSAARSDPHIGLVNPEWQLPKRYPLGRTIYYSTVIRANKGRIVDTDWARGFCFLITRELIRRIGGLDLEFSPGYYDDWDYSIRAVKSGFRVVRARGAFVWHYKNITITAEFGAQKLNTLLGQKQELFHQLWGYPLHVLIVAEKAWDQASLNAIIADLLRDQHRITMVTPGVRPMIRHDNLKTFLCPGFLAGMVARGVLFDNVRHSAKKRFSLIVCSPRRQEALSRLRAIAHDYRFFALELPHGSYALSRLVARLKREKRGGAA